MKTFTTVMAVALGLFLVSPAVYAAGQNNDASYNHPFPPMVLPVAGPAVPAAVTPGAGPETSSAPIMSREPVAATPPIAKSKPLANPTGDFFAKAKEAYMKTDLKAAADEIRKGAAVLRMEESKATSELKRELAASAEDLERLAQSVERESVKAQGEFDAVFSRADRALARHNAEQAAGHASVSHAIAPEPVHALPAQQMSPATPAPANRAEVSGLSSEELTKRINMLSKEIATLQAELNKLKAKEAGMKS